jgi:hypothetical protein
VSLHSWAPRSQSQWVGALGLRLDMRCLPDVGRPPWTVMTAFSSRNGVVLLMSSPSSSSAPQVRDPKVMKLLIMPQSLSLCLMGYVWFGQASSRNLLKWSVDGLTGRLLLWAMVEMHLMPKPPASVTSSFKAKTECIPLCVWSSFTHKATNSEINCITSVCYIVSYYKNLLQVQNGLSSGKDTILPQADDWGLTCLEEVFIKELFIFWAAGHSSNMLEIGQEWVHKVFSKCRK